MKTKNRCFIGYSLLLLMVLIMGIILSCASPATTPQSPVQPQGQPSEEEAKVLDIGVLAALTGFGSEAMKINAHGSEVARDWINENGGIDVKGQKYKINLIIEDNKCTADGAVAAANKLVYDKNVKFVIGGVMPHVLIAEATVTEPNKVLRVAVYNNTSDDINATTTPYTFIAHNGTIGGVNSSLAYIADYRPEVKTVVTVSDELTKTTSAPMFMKKAQENGLKAIEPVITWNQQMIDYAPLVTKAVSYNPDSIALINGWPGLQGGILKIARESGHDNLMFCCNYHDIEDIVEVAGKSASTNFVTQGVAPNDPEMPPLMREVLNRLQSEYGHSRIFYAEMGFGGVWCLAQAIEAAQSLDPEVVKDTWEKMDTMKTLYGTALMGGQQTFGMRHQVCSPMRITGLDNGKIVPLAWIDAEELYIP